MSEPRSMNWVDELLEWDWVYAYPRYNVLHYVTKPEGAGDDWVYDGMGAESACGRSLQSVAIPGWGSRISLPRCKQCCRELGYPAGTGSPKNDDACRPLVEARIRKGVAVGVQDHVTGV